MPLPPKLPRLPPKPPPPKPPPCPPPPPPPPWPPPPPPPPPWAATFATGMARNAITRITIVEKSRLVVIVHLVVLKVALSSGPPKASPIELYTSRIQRK